MPVSPIRPLELKFPFPYYANVPPFLWGSGVWACMQYLYLCSCLVFIYFCCICFWWAILQPCKMAKGSACCRDSIQRGH